MDVMIPGNVGEFTANSNKKARVRLQRAFGEKMKKHQIRIMLLTTAISSIKNTLPIMDLTIGGNGLQMSPPS